MKRNIRTSIFVLTVLVSLLMTFGAVSCALLAPEPGRIEIEFSQENLQATVDSGSALSSRALLSPGQSARYVRIYLESQGGLIPFGSRGAVIEMAIPASNVIVIEDVPPLRNCMLYISLSVEGSVDFRTVKYVQSNGTFNVIAGGTSELTMKGVESPFEDLETARDVAGVDAVEVGGTMYHLANGILSWNDGQARTLAVSGATGLGKGKALKSDGTAEADQVWVNTDGGILPLEGSVLGAELTGKTFGAGSPVLESGMISLTYDDPDDDPDEGPKPTDVAFYQKPGSAGVGLSLDDAWEWIDLYDVFDENSEYYSDGFSSLEDLIKDNNSKLIADYAMSGTFGYMVIPAINSLRVGGDFVDKVEALGDDLDFSKLKDTLLTGNTVSVPKIGGLQPLIQGVSQAGTLLFIGTDLGVFFQTVGVDGVPDNQTPSQIALPRKVNVGRIRSKLVGDTVWTAVLGKAGGVYLIANKAGEIPKIHEFRFFTGIPEFGGKAAETGDLFWTATGDLIVTGTNGIVSLSNDKLSEL